MSVSVRLGIYFGSVGFEVKPFMKPTQVKTMQIAAHPSCIRYMYAVFDSELLAHHLQDFMAPATTMALDKTLQDCHAWCVKNLRQVQSIGNEREENNNNESNGKRKKLRPPDSSRPSTTPARESTIGGYDPRSYPYPVYAATVPQFGFDTGMMAMQAQHHQQHYAYYHWPLLQPQTQWSHQPYEPYACFPVSVPQPGQHQQPAPPMPREYDAATASEPKSTPPTPPPPTPPPTPPPPPDVGAAQETKIKIVLTRRSHRDAWGDMQDFEEELNNEFGEKAG